MTELFIALTDVGAFEVFWRDNEESLREIADKDVCFALACNCELIIGGGAAPLFRIGFID